MTEFRLFRSNSLLQLGTFLSVRLREDPLQDPIQPEVIGIGYRGIESWLTREITQTVGVGANLDYPFQSRVIREKIRSLYRLVVDPTLPQDDPWTANTMAWAIADLLPAHLTDPHFAPLRRLLEDHVETSELVDHRRIDLATQIANIFDRYLMYRPDWVLAWGNQEPAPTLRLPEEQAWQPILWRALKKRFGKNAPHLAEILSSLTPEQLTALDPQSIRENLELHRLSIFGLNSLPKTLLLALQALAHVVAIDLYVFSPSNRYWADIRGDAQRRDQYRYDHEGYAHAFSEHFETAHPLLLSLGRSARDFQHLLLEQMDQGLEDFTQPEAFIHREAQVKTALHQLQADLQKVLLDTTKHPLPPTDRSLQVHACHGAARQVEVLKESLLHLLNQDSTLEPRDILVLCPDLDTYAPLLGAVFGSGASHYEPTTGWGHDGVPALEYRFADLSMRRLNPVAEALMRVLDLAQSRLGIDDVMGLLSLDAIQRRFGFQPSDLEAIQTLFEQSDIRWGMDAAHRVREGQPADSAFTWEQGLTQLALGAAMSDQGSAFQNDTFFTQPMDRIEGEGFELAGKCLHFCTHLFQVIRTLQEPAPLTLWTNRILNLLDWLTETPEQAAFLKRRCSDVLNDLADAARLAKVTDDAVLSVEAVQLLLRGRFDVAYSSGRASLHAIQCSNFQSLRGIPARVVVLLGMDDGSFPRQSVRSNMDLTNAPRWIGDSDPREEERGALLDAILAAGDHLLVFYTGRDKETHEPLEPAGPIRELLDTIDLTFEPLEPGTLPSETLTRVHPLHRFATDNYQSESPWSFSERGLQSSRIFRDADFKVRTPIGVGSGTPPTRSTRITHFTLPDLGSWLLKPQRMYANTVLRVKPYDRIDGENVREPIQLSSFEYAEIGSELMGQQDMLLGQPLDTLETLDPRAYALPLGAPGKLTFEALEEKVQRAKTRYSALINVDQAQTLTPSTWHSSSNHEPLSLSCPGFTYYRDEVETFLPTLSTGYLNESYYLYQWLLHLVATIQSKGQLQATRALLITQGDDDAIETTFRIPRESNDTRLNYATDALTQLLGLTFNAQVAPPPLFRKTSFRAVEALLKAQLRKGEQPGENFEPADAHPAALASALTAAKTTWGDLSKKTRGFPECQDATLKALYRGTMPFLESGHAETLSHEFLKSAMDLWLPILLNMSQGEAS